MVNAYVRSFLLKNKWSHFSTKKINTIKCCTLFCCTHFRKRDSSQETVYWVYNFIGVKNFSCQFSSAGFFEAKERERFQKQNRISVKKKFFKFEEKNLDWIKNFFLVCLPEEIGEKEKKFVDWTIFFLLAIQNFFFFWFCYTDRIICSCTDKVIYYIIFFRRQSNLFHLVRMVKKLTSSTWKIQ